MESSNCRRGELSVISQSFSHISDTGIIERDRTEIVPHLAHYDGSVSDSARPTLHELRQAKRLSITISPGDIPKKQFADKVNDIDVEKGQSTADVSEGGPKFGWMQGVLVRCTLNIFGVMLFLRLPWVTGQAGIGLATVIVVLSAVVTAITTMSMSAICTNGKVKGGGAYFMISRSLGPEFGGSIGIVLALANAVGAAMYIVGFAETVRDIMWENGVYITGDSINEVRIIGIATCCFCVGIILVGMKWEAKAQVVLLGILAIAIVNFFVGTFLSPDDDKKWKGVVGYNENTFSTNFVPHFSAEHNFFSVFAIFFSAATGALAGADISGDLKNPQTAIPKGTFLAVQLTTLVFIAMVWTIGSCTVLSAVGALPVAKMEDPFTNDTLKPTIDLIQNCQLFNQTCNGGLLNDYGIVGVVSAWRPLILAGVFATTLSSALASIVGAPKIFQAVSKDKLFPFIHVFAKGYGAGGEPIPGYFLCFGICVSMVCVGSLDVIAPIISNFYLMAYAMINFSCFDASLGNSPGFRPGFKYYNKWISLFGSLMCIGGMFVINWWAALVTFVMVAGLYFCVHRNKPEVNWGSSAQANAYRNALKTTLKLTKVNDHVKNFRPQILALTGHPKNRANLVDFAATITKKQSLLVCGHVLRGDLKDHVSRIRSMAVYKWFENKKIYAFYNSVCAPTFRSGVQVLLQTLGVGKLRPNTLLLGYKCNWQNADPNDVIDYFNVIQDAFDMRYNVGILCCPGGFHWNHVSDDVIDIEHPDMFDLDEEIKINNTEINIIEEGINSHEISNNDDGSDSGVDAKSDLSEDCKDRDNVSLQSIVTIGGGLDNVAFEDDSQKSSSMSKMHSSLSVSSTESQCRSSVSKMHSSQSVSSTESQCRSFKDRHYGTVDVWWLYDDGGLTLLLPYILSQRKQWKNAKLRVFCIGSEKGDADEDRTRMASLLAKFRIEYSELTVLTDMHKKCHKSTYGVFESLIHQWRLKPDELEEEIPWKIADTHIDEHKPKTNRLLRLREKLLEHSREASLIVMTLPVPRKTAFPAGLYMGWLEIISKDLPPTLLVRGNQESVLTFYS